MGNIKDIQQIKVLIAKGKAVGYLTFDEVNKALPSEASSPEQVEEIIGIFDQLEISIVDSEKDGKKISVSAGEPDDEPVTDAVLDLVDDEEGADYSSRSTDPVRMYLREMGAVPLLDREGEVQIAKKIETGEQDVLYALVEVPVAKMFLDLGIARGPLLAYLLADPELSLQSILVLNGVMGKKKTAIYVGLVALFSTLAGYLFGLAIAGL